MCDCFFEVLQYNSCTAFLQGIYSLFVRLSGGSCRTRQRQAYVCTYIYIYIQIHIHTHAHTHTRAPCIQFTIACMLRTYKRTGHKKKTCKYMKRRTIDQHTKTQQRNTHAYTHAYTHACMHACVRACVHACMHACMRACTHTYI